jgi:hypothetical protein
MGYASEKVFKLSNYSGSLGLSCDECGLELAGVPLLNKTNQGFIARPPNEIEHLIASAYGADTYNDLTMTRLQAVARALNAGDLAYAMTAAVLLKFSELDWNGAVRIAQADDLLKYNPDEPRDWHGRWTTGGGGTAIAPNVQLLSAPANNEVTEIAAAFEQENDASTSNPFPLPPNWVHLPPGDRIDELGDLLEWIANAKPSDAPAIYDEIDRQYIQNGDLGGALTLAEALSAATETNPTAADRQAILDRYEYLTHIDPREAGQATINEAAMLMQLGLVPGGGSSDGGSPPEEQSAVPNPNQPNEIWKQGWAARGDFFSKALGENLYRTFPVIDSFTDGIATSIKSIDLNAITYQNAGRLAARLTSYVNNVADFNGMDWGAESIRYSQIEGRTLSLAVPKRQHYDRTTCSYSICHIGGEEPRCCGNCNRILGGHGVI